VFENVEQMIQKMDQSVCLCVYACICVCVCVREWKGEGVVKHNKHIVDVPSLSLFRSNINVLVSCRYGGKGGLGRGVNFTNPLAQSKNGPIYSIQHKKCHWYSPTNMYFTLPAQTSRN